MSPTPSPGCQDFTQVEMSRRNMLSTLGVAGAAAATTSVFGDTVRTAAFGATRAPNVLVVISLRGGVDGLGMVVPHGDSGYYSARPTIGVPRKSLLATDAMFGLHPSMKPLAEFFTSKELAAVVATGMPAPNRSHFSAMEAIEDADPLSAQRRGWVNRMSGLTAGNDPLNSVHLAESTVPTALVGPTAAMSTVRLERVVLPGGDPVNDSSEWARRRARQLRTTWAGDRRGLGEGTRSALKVSSRLAKTISAGYQTRNGAKYPNTKPAHNLAAALQDTVQLIRADVGTEVISIDYGSWDLHADYGTLQAGQMTPLIDGFARALAAFLTDLGPQLRKRVTVVTLSEFGRRVNENGNRGLDHGWGNMMLVAGGGVRGGAYHGRWPGLGSGKLVDGDLAVTTDYRDVLGEIVASRFPKRPVSKVFPGHTYRPIGVMR